jgi:hypothetical protein
LRFWLPLRRKRCVPLHCQCTFAKIESLLSHQNESQTFSRSAVQLLTHLRLLMRLSCLKNSWYSES